VRSGTGALGNAVGQSTRFDDGAGTNPEVDSCMAEPARDLTVTGDLAGEYSGDEELPDGSLAIRADTSAAAIRRRAGLEQISADEFGEHLCRLPADRARADRCPTAPALASVNARRCCSRAVAACGSS
jgi:hypothetical protein